MDIDTTPALSPLDPLSFFTLQGLGKRFKRHGPGESSQDLLLKSERSGSIEVYDSYRESLNSLIEMVDNVSFCFLRVRIIASQLTMLSPCRMTQLRSN